MTAPVPAPLLLEAPGGFDAGRRSTARARDAQRLVIAGLAVIVTVFGFFGGWAAISPLDSAVVTYGVIGADGNRKSVQHLDGGVVRSILVKEGELVQEGQELIRLDQIQARAGLEIQNAAVDTYTAIIARLEAEAGGREANDVPEALASRADNPAVKELIRSQGEVFEARRSAIAAQITTIGEQVKQARSQVAIYEGQVAAADQQYRLVNEELGPKKFLFDKGYATNSPVLQLQRAAAALLGQKQEYTGHIERLGHTVAQLESQMRQTESDYRLKVAQELEDARNKLSEAREKQRVAEDVLERTVIRAPVTGYVLGLAVHTLGAVVGRGERLLEIVPQTGDFVITARVPPADGANIHAGMRTELRLLTDQGRALPLLHGLVRDRSADLKSDAGTSTTYYEIQVKIDAADLKSAPDLMLMPGTPIEVIVPTGSRTALQYLIEPVSKSLRHGLRER